MLASDPKTWPIDFSVLEKDPPDGWILFTTVLDPVLSIARENNDYVVNLGARLVRRAGTELLAAPSPESNWVCGNGLIYPLPKDIPSVINRLLAGTKPKSLSFPEVLRLQQADKDEIQIELDESVLVSANDAADREATPLVVPNLQANLYPYQSKGISWMRNALSRTGGVILADEMGLGKTLQIISLLLLDPPDPNSPALVVCPTTLIANWVREFEKFSPSLTVMIHRGSGRGTLPRHLLGAQVVISTYDTVVNDLVLFKAVEWSWLICDEAQALKNPDSQRRQAISDIPRRRTIPVTGTPVETRLLDLWSLADIAIPGLLGTRDVFESSYSDTDDSARDLARITSPIVLKRRVKDVAQDLPERTDVLLPLELDADLADEYESVRLETVQKYPKAGSLVATGRLQIFCAHPVLVSGGVESDEWEELVSLREGSSLVRMTPKLLRTIELVTESFANNRKVLIFANFNACGPIIRSVMRLPASVYWGAINGSTPQEDRQQIVDEFEKHDGDAVLVLNPKAAGAGLNITAATVVIHYTQVWNPALEAQASARAHRRGQKNPVTVYHLYYVDTVEQVMMDRSQMRRELGAEAVPTSADDAADLSRALSISPVGK
jgi:SNF2 family DNA or RNA helicase